jgi:hypothetical protein
MLLAGERYRWSEVKLYERKFSDFAKKIKSSESQVA